LVISGDAAGIFVTSSRVRSLGGAWIATGEEVAGHFIANEKAGK
jgi:hypothetical protein